MGFINAKKVIAKKLIAKAGVGVVTKQIGLYETIARWIARGIQLIFALIVAGLYGHRIDEDRQAGTPQSAAWVFATLVAGVSCITCIVYAIPFVPVHRLFYMDLSLFILWLITFGMFASIFLKLESGTDYEGTSVRVMKIAVWINLVNCLLWLATCGYGALRTYAGKKAEQKQQQLKRKFDDKLEALEHKAVDKFAERLPPGMVPAHFPPSRDPGHFV